MTLVKTPGTVFLLLALVIHFPASALQQKDSAENHQKQFEKIIRSRADSIRKIVDRSVEDSTGVNALIEYAVALHVTSLDSAYSWLEKALSLTEKISFKKGTVRVLSQMGAVFQDRKNYPEAIRLYKQSYLIAEANNFTFETLQGYQRILNLYFYLGEFTEAMKLSTKGLAMGERSKNIRLEAYYVNLIGFIYLRQNNVEQAHKYYSAYLGFGEQLGDSTIIGEAYNNLAEVFTAKKNHEVALDFLYRTLNLYQRLYVRKQLWKADRLAYVTFRIGCNFRSQGNFPEALRYCLKAVNYTKTTSCNKYDIASYYIYTGDCYRALGNPDKAVDYLEYGLALAREIRHRENIRDAYEFLALTYASRGQYEKAFRFHQLYDQLEDSIVNEKSAREIEQVLAAYSMEKKDREIEALQQQKKLSETEIQRQRLAGNAAIMLLIFSLILLYLLYTRYRLKQKNRFQTELNLQQNKMFNAIVSVQDKERKRIAQDIHDTLGSILSTAKLRLSGMEEYSDSMTDRQREQYVTIIGLLDEAVSELRNISHNIMPAALSRLGLVAALQNLLEKINTYSGIQIHYNVHGLSGRLEESTEITVYRIILELVNNVVKHAQASSLTVQLIQYTDHLNATVEDDGKGFEYDQVRKLKSGIGLNNIISRIGYLNGKIEIDTGPGKGTSIALDIPLGVSKL